MRGHLTATNLEPGFEFDLTTTGGALTLTALNDDIATTRPASRALYLPLIRRHPQ